MKNFLLGVKILFRLARNIQDLESILTIQRNNLDSPYMYGLYNGVLLAYCLITSSDYNPLSIPNSLQESK